MLRRGCVICGALALASAAGAGFVETVTVADFGTISGASPSATFWLGWGLTEYGPGAVLFENQSVTSADIGHTWFATPASDPDFAAVVAGFSDGLDEYVHFGFVLHGGGEITTSGHESAWFFLDDPDRVDFAGLTIGAIWLTVNDLTLQPLGSGQTAWSYELTYTFSDVPEPGPLVLLILGGGFLARRARRIHGVK